MTNEQLADFIKQGGNDELIPLLWDKVKVLYYMRVDRYYRAYKSVFDKRGVTVYDLKQCCYPAYLRALEAYSSDKGYKFSSYTKYSIKGAIRPLMENKDLLNDCLSLNTPAHDKDGAETETTHLELVEDETAIEDFEQVELSDEHRLVHEAVDQLPDDLKAVINGYYFENKNYRIIGEELGKSPERIRQMLCTAYKALRKSKQLYGLYKENRDL